VVPAEGGKAADRLANEGVNALQLPLHRIRATRKLRPHVDFFCRLIPDTGRLARLLIDRRTDVVIQTTLVPPHGAIAARRAGVPLVWQLVDTRPPPAVREASMVMVRRWSDRVMFCGGRLVKWHVRGHPLRVPYEVFYPPVDTARFHGSQERRKRARQLLRIPPDASVVGMVANINPQKGWEYFVGAAAAMYREVSDLHLVMVGAVEEAHRGYLAALEAEMARSGVPRERFIMIGGSQEVESLLPAFDLKLITSVPRSEGTPTTALEALSSGVPVVSADVGAVSEVLGDGECGYVARPLDASDIAAKGLRILCDRSLQRRLSNAARIRAVTRYDARLCAEQHAVAFEGARRHFRARLSGKAG
jgi:glycosyltransferase involved in cell wall biosynthesis